MELHNAIETVIENEDEMTLNGEEYTLVPTDEIERLRRIHCKCQEIRRLMYSD